MLTRLVIAYGLEYCHLDELAEHFLHLSRDIRRWAQELSDFKSTATNGLANKSGAEGSLLKLRRLIASDLSCSQATPAYERLIATLSGFEGELSQLLMTAKDGRQCEAR